MSTWGGWRGWFSHFRCFFENFWDYFCLSNRVWRALDTQLIRARGKSPGAKRPSPVATLTNPFFLEQRTKIQTNCNSTWAWEKIHPDVWRSHVTRFLFPRANFAKSGGDFKGASCRRILPWKFSRANFPDSEEPQKNHNECRKIINRVPQNLRFQNQN